MSVTNLATGYQFPGCLTSEGDQPNKPADSATRVDYEHSLDEQLQNARDVSSTYTLRCGKPWRTSVE